MGMQPVQKELPVYVADDCERVFCNTPDADGQWTFHLESSGVALTRIAKGRYRDTVTQKVYCSDDPAAP